MTNIQTSDEADRTGDAVIDVLLDVIDRLRIALDLALLEGDMEAFDEICKLVNVACASVDRRSGRQCRS